MESQKIAEQLVVLWAASCTEYSVTFPPDGDELMRAIAAALDAARGRDIDALAASVLEMCKLRGWSLRWTERGVYLHLEASELIEAIRGKHGDPLREAADVLLVLMSITENAGIPFSSVIETVRVIAADLRTKSHYAGEEFSRKGEGEA